MKGSETNKIFEKMEPEYLPAKEKKGWNKHSIDTTCGPKSAPVLFKPRAQRDTSASLTNLMRNMSLTPVAQSSAQLTLPKRLDLDTEAVSPLGPVHEKITRKKDWDIVGEIAIKEEKKWF
jgi:hypothetical protein